MDFMKFIGEQTLILIPVIYVLGVFLKLNSKVPDWIIPWVLLVVGIGFSVGLTGITVQAVIQGILVVGAAVLGNQLIKQTTEGIKKDNTPEAPKEIDPSGEITNDIK
jgi:hypothetical protein